MATITGVDVVTIVVEDQEEALTFYLEELGFHLDQDEEYGDQGRWIEISPPDSDVSLKLKTPEMFDSDEAVHRRALIGRSPQITYQVGDCMEIFQSLTDRGIPFEDEPKSKPWGTQATLRDPSGNLVVLTEK